MFHHYQLSTHCVWVWPGQEWAAAAAGECWSLSSVSHEYIWCKCPRSAECWAAVCLLNWINNLFTFIHGSRGPALATIQGFMLAVLIFINIQSTLSSTVTGWIWTLWTGRFFMRVLVPKCSLPTSNFNNDSFDSSIFARFKVYLNV